LRDHGEHRKQAGEEEVAHLDDAINCCSDFLAAETVPRQIGEFLVGNLSPVAAISL
jgi:hypothetical protein